MPPVKLTLVGAGSAFTLSVVADMALRPHLAGSTIALVDTDGEALDLSARIASRMVQAAGADLTIESATERTALLPGSDFVLNSISVGEPWAREGDVAIGEEYGIYQPTSQTVGPAGFVRGLRVIPHAVAIAKDVAALCPAATVLDLANPMAPVCRAMVREAGVKVVGLCEAWKMSLPLLARAVGLPVADLDLVSVGTNHLGWALALYHGGRDVLPEALERLHRSENRALLDSAPVARDIYAALGLWPTGSEDHIAEWFPYFLTPQTHGGADYNLTTRHTTRAQQEERRALRRAMANGDSPVDYLLAPSGESVVEIIAGMVGSEPPSNHTVNLPNEGLIDGLPAHAIVELPAYVSGGQVRGLRVGPLPPAITAILNTRTTQQELMVDAALSGDRRVALAGFLLDAQVIDLRAASEILERSLAVNAEWLPSFGR
ncbi:MAG: family 4 glycosyl hydrolase [Anaerolineae bacterium]